jgi:pyruvate, water dikinase
MLAHLRHVDDESQFGGKAVSLGAAIRAALPVPEGMAMSYAMVDAVARADADALKAVRESPHVPAGRLAVRSSAVGEDSSGASFAGQHATKLNVNAAMLVDAVRLVWESGRSAAALAYRAKKGLPPEPRVGVVVQSLVEPIAAGVLFTRNPMTGVDERMIEATWGLGEAVVSGAVVPDRFRLSSDGRIVETSIGDKDLQITNAADGGTVEVPVPESRRNVSCLEPRHLEALHSLASRCGHVWGDALDIEWALAPDDRVYLLQCRPITTLQGRS